MKSQWSHMFWIGLVMAGPVTAVAGCVFAEFLEVTEIADCVVAGFLEKTEVAGCVLAEFCD